MLKVLVILGLTIGSLAWAEEEKNKEERIGLLAPTLGLAPVPGYENPPDQRPVEGPYGQETEGVLPVPGFQGGNGPCQCVPVEQCPSHKPPGPGPYPGPDKEPVIKDPHHDKDKGGYGPGDEEFGTNPEKDGAGIIDIRIVNRPPGPGGVQCSPGFVFCCGAKEPVQEYPGGIGITPIGPGGCGHRNFLDVPGWVPEYGQAKFGAYPWMALILGPDNKFIGAGALLNSYYVLTAAHKVQHWKPGAYLKVRLGEWNAKEDNEPFKNVEIDVEYVDIHPQFNPDNLYNDVALIKLAKPIDVNEFPHIGTACLPKVPAISYVGQRCWVSGFGKDAFEKGSYSFIMKEVDLPIVDGHTCENHLRTTKLGYKFQLNKHSFLCAGGEEGKDACKGDGGAPLVCESGGVWSVVGLVAWGIGCADHQVPGVYVNVPNFAPWIESKIAGTAGGGHY